MTSADGQYERKGQSQMSGGQSETAQGNGPDGRTDWFEKMDILNDNS